MTENEIIDVIRQGASKFAPSEIVKRSKLNTSTVWRFFNCKNSVSLKNAIRIANACGISIITTEAKQNDNPTNSSKIQEKN